MMLSLILMNCIAKFSKKGIREMGIEAHSWSEIEYFQLDKDKRLLTFKAKDWTSAAVCKIDDKEWDDNIEDFLSRHLEKTF
jgi:hypothetical protein